MMTLHNVQKYIAFISRFSLNNSRGERGVIFYRSKRGRSIEGSDQFKHCLLEEGH